MLARSVAPAIWAAKESSLALSWKTRRRLTLLILLVGLPIYIVASITILNWFERPPLWLEFLVYGALGVVWALPFKAVFRGVGKPDPEAEDPPA